MMPRRPSIQRFSFHIHETDENAPLLSHIESLREQGFSVAEIVVPALWRSINQQPPESSAQITRRQMTLMMREMLEELQTIIAENEQQTRDLVRSLLQNVQRGDINVDDMQTDADIDSVIKNLKAYIGRQDS